MKAAGFFKYIWPSGHQVWREINTFSTLTHIRSWIDSYRHQSTDLRCKSTDWFLYKYNISLILFNEVFYCCCSLRYHSFSTHANFFEKQYFSPPNTHTYVCLSGGWEGVGLGEKRQSFKKFCVPTKWKITYCWKYHLKNSTKLTFQFHTLTSISCWSPIDTSNFWFGEKA